MNDRPLRAIEPGSRWERWMRAVLTVGRFTLLLLFIPVAHVLCGNPLDEQAAFRTKLEHLRIERDALQVQRDRLLRRMEWIKSDAAYLELAARDRLHLQKDGEHILRFEAE